MTWTKLDDQYAEHPKLVAVGPLAAWLNTAAINYSSRHLTDGFVPLAKVRTLVDFHGYGVRTARGWQQIDVMALVDALVENRLWERCEGGYTIHDYLEYNPSAGQVRAERAKQARRIASHRAREKPGAPDEVGATAEGSSALSSGLAAQTTLATVANAMCNAATGAATDGITDDITDGVTAGATGGERARAPFPSPFPSSSSPSASAEGAAAPRRESAPRPRGTSPADIHPAVLIYREIVGRLPNKQQQAEIARLVTDAGAWRKCVGAWTLRGNKPTNVEGMLDWYRDGIPRPPRNGVGREPPNAANVRGGYDVDSIPADFRGLVEF